MKKTKEELDKIIEEKEVEKLIIGGDFNARIGQEGSDFRIEEKHGVRRSKGKVKNTEGKLLLEIVEEREWNILNGNTEGDEKGEYTYRGPRWSTVIDYIIMLRIWRAPRVRGSGPPRESRASAVPCSRN